MQSVSQSVSRALSANNKTQSHCVLHPYTPSPILFPFSYPRQYAAPADPTPTGHPRQTHPHAHLN
ncbi:hypothetical protein E2C01_067535 [Portunus trituberculatus]|uniref:Uncharacterized protein n=1 Tax=Portunus trituberculatus TaxID=210409 RepID=A0A5B7HSW7_PORTR|nr:hypothetical protein [Portunus trituberculatus]